MERNVRKEERRLYSSNKRLEERVNIAVGNILPDDVNVLGLMMQSDEELERRIEEIPEVIDYYRMRMEDSTKYRGDDVPIFGDEERINYNNGDSELLIKFIRKLIEVRALEKEEITKFRVIMREIRDSLAGESGVKKHP